MFTICANCADTIALPVTDGKSFVCSDCEYICCWSDRHVDPDGGWHCEGCYGGITGSIAV